MISSGVLGGGIGLRERVLNAQVPARYATAAEDFTGPRSAWGARIARSVYAAVLAGAIAYRDREPTERT